MGEDLHHYSNEQLDDHIQQHPDNYEGYLVRSHRYHDLAQQSFYGGSTSSHWTQHLQKAIQDHRKAAFLLSQSTEEYAKMFGRKLYDGVAEWERELVNGIGRGNL
jgi:hypothetical protein